MRSARSSINVPKMKPGGEKGGQSLRFRGATYVSRVGPTRAPYAPCLSPVNRETADGLRSECPVDGRCGVEQPTTEHRHRQSPGPRQSLALGRQALVRCLAMHPDLNHPHGAAKAELGRPSSVTTVGQAKPGRRPVQKQGREPADCPPARHKDA